MPEQAPAPSVPPAVRAPGAEEALIRLSTEIARYSTLSDLMDHLPAHLGTSVPGRCRRRRSPRRGGGRDVSGAELPIGAGQRAAPRAGRLGSGELGVAKPSRRGRICCRAADSHPTLRALYECGFRCVHWVPMTTGRKRLGTFAVARYTADPDRDFERVLSWVASVVALAIEHTHRWSRSNSCAASSPRSATGRTARCPSSANA